MSMIEGDKMNERKNAEFHIGATLFSVIGALFILIALVILGVNYLDKFVLQMLLYLLGLGLIVLSELLLRKINVHLGNIVTSLGVGVLFVPTSVNGPIKDAINGSVSILIGFVVGIAGIFLGKVRNSWLIRTVNLTGFISVVIVNLHLDTPLKLMMVSTLIVIFGVLINVFSINSYSQIEHSVLMVYLLSLGGLMTYSATKNDLGYLYIMFGLIALFIVSEISTIFSEKKNELVSYCFAVITSALMCIGICFECYVQRLYLSDDLSVSIFKILTLVIIVAVCGLVYALSEHNGINSKLQVYLAFLALLVLCINSDSVPEFIVLMLAVLGLRLLGRLKHFSYLDAGFYLLSAFIVRFSDISDIWYVILIALIVYLAGLFIFTHNYVYNEIVGILIISNLISKFYDVLGNSYLPMLDEFDVSNGLAFLVEGILLLYFVGFSRFKNHKQVPVAATIMSIQGLTVFGMVTINEFLVRFGTAPELIAMIYESLMVMIVAVLYVIYGFRASKTYFRIMGLVFAGLVCLKFLGVDLRGVEALYRILGFLGVGILALTISIVYIRFDKKQVKGSEEQG